MRGTFRLSLALSFVFILFLAACTGNNGAPPMPENADGTLGRKPKEFFHVDSATHVTIISVPPTKSVAEISNASQFVWNASSGIQFVSSIPLTQLTFSSDGNYLTVVGNPLIFEFHPIAASTLTTASVSQITPTVDTLCFGMPKTRAIGQSTYTELQFQVQDGGYSLIGIGTAGNDVLGTATKLANGFLVPGFGNFTINASQPFSDDSTYYQTNIAGSSLGTVSNLYCHSNLNVTPIGNQGPCFGYSVCDQFQAPDGTSLSSHLLDTGGSWAVVNASPAVIQGGAADILAVVPNGNVSSQITTVFSSRDVTVQADANLGLTGMGEVIGFIARFKDSNNFMAADVYRDNALSYSKIRIWEKVAGVWNIVAQRTLPQLTDIVHNTFVPMELNVTGSNYTFTYDGISISYANGSALLTGTGIGMSSTDSSPPTVHPMIKLFRAK